MSKRAANTMVEKNPKRNKNQDITDFTDENLHNNGSEPLQPKLEREQDAFVNTRFDNKDRVTEKCNKATEKNNKQFDIIAHLSQEIVNLVLQELWQEQCFELLAVSKAWRDKVSAYASVWRTIEIRGDEDCVKNIIRLLPYVCEHVVELSEIYGGLLSNALYAQIAKGGFSKLQRLYLDNQLDSSVPTLIVALSQVAKTLECLTINIDNIPAAVDQKKIFDTCTELRSLIIDHDTPTALEIIESSCKRLERFCIGKSHFCNKFKEGNVTMNEKRKHHRQLRSSSSTFTGIQDFALNIHKNPKRYIPIIQRNQATIQTLYLDIWNAAYDTDEDELKYREDWELLGDSCKFPNLQSLSIHSDCIMFKPLMARVIRNSPNIRALIFDTVFLEELDQEFLTAITTLSSLQMLEVDGETGGEEDLRVIFDAMAPKGKTDTSTLESVKFTSIDFDLRGIIDSLANIPTIRHLEFGYLISESNERECLDHLCSRFQSHPGIRSLSFKEVDNIDDEMLVHLAAIEGLESLHLEDICWITPQGWSVFDDSSVKLTTVRCNRN
ncbi:hypothetical protein BDA99DRAFT_539715 [Phascolomyces articulosus]|uniref:F-box domain-containing protein n=1 Tax=Phascolomyces articulosus TaxID=60185 RepID=A0AAD5K5L6_9FUNG|nr:hypothetical protein BDA99DRAFT_539715 [Phascolomyces articulosus]